jgi:hypothetical protein
MSEIINTVAQVTEALVAVVTLGLALKLTEKLKLWWERRRKRDD